MLSKNGGDSRRVVYVSTFTTSRPTVSGPFSLPDSALTAIFFQDHFHVHIVNSNYVGLPGMNTGQAHLLDDLISLVRITCDLKN